MNEMRIEVIQTNSQCTKTTYLYLIFVLNIK